MRPIHLIPLANGAGPLEPGLVDLEHLAATLVRTFRTACRIRPEVFDVSFALDAGRKQYYSTSILQRLERASDPDARILGVTACDLYVPVLTFVFGEAQLTGRCALVSCHRLRDEFDYRTYTAAQLRKLIESIGKWDIIGVFDFWYELDEPQKLDNELVDTLLVLQRR